MQWRYIRNRFDIISFENNFIQYMQWRYIRNRFDICISNIYYYIHTKKKETKMKLNLKSVCSPVGLILSLLFLFDIQL